MLIIPQLLMVRNMSTGRSTWSCVLNPSITKLRKRSSRGELLPQSKQIIIQNLWSLKKDWTLAENEEAIENSCAFNAIYDGVDKNIFKIINRCINYKKKYETLKLTHKGTFKVHMSRIQLLTNKFENLKMLEE